MNSKALIVNGVFILYGYYNIVTADGVMKTKWVDPEGTTEVVEVRV